MALLGYSVCFVLELWFVFESYPKVGVKWYAMEEFCIVFMFVVSQKRLFVTLRNTLELSNCLSFSVAYFGEKKKPAVDVNSQWRVSCYWVVFMLIPQYNTVLLVK